MKEIKWTGANGEALTTSVQYPPVGINNTYIGISTVKVTKSDWDSWKSFKCAVDHQEKEKSAKVEKPPPPKVILLREPKGNNQILFCTVRDFLPKEISVKWTKNGENANGSTYWDAQKNGETYSALSLLEVPNSDWNSEAVFSCEVSHRGKTYTRKASKVPITVTLKQPTAKKIFQNQQAQLKCVITGQDQTIVEKSQITWKIDGQTRTSSTTETAKLDGNVYMKISTLTQTFNDWLTVKTVQCSAEGEDVSPVTQEIIVQKDGTDPTVTIYIPAEQKGEMVILMCLVSSKVKQDYYIAWTDDIEKSNGNYTDGITISPQKTENGYSVISLYTTNKTKWKRNHMFHCNVRPAGSNKVFNSAVSGALDFLNVTLSLSCVQDDPEDDFSSLWSTTSTFICLFMFSISYSVIFSLHQMKKN
ncbi:hypothetical protein CHARACLAT_012443 [Characodon lateralis]|uniref:Ig-like domain-containing protein n=1 Tax=Characodon lateralis TaxID=208331 RepID=A0ABU7DSF2_9TELE|nr:hypothetical protein [Characodon lateralis]